MSFLRDLKIAMRSLSRVRALWITVALTLALGIGANAAIFSVVRAVLLRPLANRDEDRLLYCDRARRASASTTRPSRFPKSTTWARAENDHQSSGPFRRSISRWWDWARRARFRPAWWTAITSR